MKHCRETDGTKVLLFGTSSLLPDDWSSLIPDDHFLRADQLLVSEKAALPDLTFLYALVYQDGKAVAACYFQVFRLKHYHLDAQQVQPTQFSAWRTFSALFHPKMLVAGHLFRHDICSFYWSPSFSPFEAYKFYQAAIGKAVRKSRSMAVLVKDMDETLVPYFQNYAPEYSLLRNDISMEMDMDEAWQTVQDYEKALKHKYAQRFRKIRNGWERLQIKELTAAETWQQKDIMFQLYNNISQKQTVRLGILNAEYLPLLKEQFPDTLKVWMVYEEERPVAFFSAWLHEKAFDMFYIGMDYSRNEELQLYFNILFFSVEQAIGFRKEKLILGRTALEAKARLGCRPHYLHTYLFIPNGLLRAFVNRIQQNVNEEEGAWENRHPFKPLPQPKSP